MFLCGRVHKRRISILLFIPICTSVSIRRNGAILIYTRLRSCKPSRLPLVHCHQFVGIHVPSFWCVGTPVQLRAFLDAVRGGTVVPRHKARFCFDLDRILLALSTPRRGSGQGDRVEPLKKNIRLLQVIRSLR